MQPMEITSHKKDTNLLREIGFKFPSLPLPAHIMGSNGAVRRMTESVSLFTAFVMSVLVDQQTCISLLNTNHCALAYVEIASKGTISKTHRHLTQGQQ